MTQEDSLRGFVRLEEDLDGEPQLTGRLGGFVHRHVEDRFRDRTEQSAAYAVVPLRLGGVDGVDCRNRAVEVAKETEFPAPTEILGPLREVGALELEGHRHMRFHGDRGIGCDKNRGLGA